MVNPIKTTVVQIKGDDWVCMLFSKEDYISLHDDSDGITLPEKKEIHFHEGEEFNLDTVCHELFHAYWTNLHLPDKWKMKVEKIEEIAACMIGANIMSLSKNVLLVFNSLSGDLTSEEI